MQVQVINIGVSLSVSDSPTLAFFAAVLFGTLLMSAALLCNRAIKPLTAPMVSSFTPPAAALVPSTMAAACSTESHGSSTLLFLGGRLA